MGRDLRLSIHFKPLIRIGVIIGGLACVSAIFISAVITKKAPLWPLLDISQYAAIYPAVYFFRAGMTLCGGALAAVGVSIIFQQERTWSCVPWTG